MNLKFVLRTFNKGVRVEIKFKNMFHVEVYTYALTTYRIISKQKPNPRGWEKSEVRDMGWAQQSGAIARLTVAR